MPILVGYLAAALVGLGIALFVTALGRRTSAGVEALQSVGVGAADRPAVRRDDDAPGAAARLASAVARLAPNPAQLTRERAQRIRARLDRAGLVLPVEGLLALKVAGAGAGVLVGLLAAVLLGAPPLVGLMALPAGGLLGYLAPDLWVLNTAQRRQQQITTAIPETLDLLALTAQAGLGLEQGVAEVSGELPGALGGELDRFLKEQQLGRGRRAALQGLIDRNSSEDLRGFALALLQADQLGTPIATTLQVQAREARRRRRARARERAGKAPVKLLFPLIFGILPALFVIIMGPGAISIMKAL